MTKCAGCTRPVVEGADGTWKVRGSTYHAACVSGAVIVGKPYKSAVDAVKHLEKTAKEKQG